MNISCKKRDWVICAYLGSLVCGLGGVATRVDAQNAAAPAVSRSVSIAASTTQVADWVADEDLKKRVKAALHADPYFSDEHVTVSIQKGSVVLRGFVFSDWDLQDALRIARKAAGDRPVIDNLSIKLMSGSNFVHGIVVVGGLFALLNASTGRAKISHPKKG